MRTIKIDRHISRTREFADKFLEEGHRATSKTLPHSLSLTFNNGVIDQNRIKDIDFIIDLLYQAMILQNDIDKVFINIDRRQKENLVILAG